MKIMQDIIRSRQNPTVKWAASLADKKARDESESFFVEGLKLALDAAGCRLPVTHVLVAQDKADALLPKLEAAFSDGFFGQTVLMRLSEECFSKISTEKAPQGVICIIKYLDFFEKKIIIYNEDFLSCQNERIVALDCVRDPGNLGTVIRSAAAFGMDRVLLSAECADIYHPRTMRAAMGSIFSVKVTIVSDLAATVRAAKAAGRRVLTAELDKNSVSLPDAHLVPSDILVIGNEGHGVGKEVSEAAGSSVYIPMTDKTESLNASAAAAVLLWEQSRSFR